MDIELKLLRSFVAIYERGSISRAAEQLSCTQAAMSMRLKMVEQELGGPLFHRLHHRLDPTPLGSEFYARALTLLSSYDELISKTRSHRSFPKLRIGLPDDYASGLFAPVIASLREVLAGVAIEIVCDLSANLAAALHRQDLDIALVTLATAPAATRFHVETRLDWVCHGEFKRLVGDALPLSAYPEGCVFRRQMIDALERAGMAWRVAVQSPSRAGVVAAVRAGAAVTAMAAGTAPGDLLSASATHGLPALGPVPIYLLRDERRASRALDQIEAALVAQLQRLATQDKRQPSRRR